jgi:RimJ/RimL family protein N-acetyltransferase
MSFIFRERPADLHRIVIDAARIQLRTLSAQDTDEIYREFTPEITRYMMAAPPARIADTVAFIKGARSALERGEDFHFVICRQNLAEFLGICGLHGRDAAPELGIWLKKSAHGQGYGFEAMGALKAWAEACIEFDCLVYPVDRRNLPSRRVAEKLGGKIIGERTVTSLSGLVLDEVVYGIQRSLPYRACS